MFERERLEPMSIEYFLAWDSHDDFKYELIAGLPVLKHREPQSLGRATTEHQLLVTAMLRLLFPRVPASCRILTDMLVRAPRANAYYLPDITVTCDERDLAVSGMGFYEHPLLVIEVLSASTAQYDLTDKLDAYVALGAEYLVVDSNRRYLRVARAMRDDRNDLGSFNQIVVDGALMLHSIDLTIDVGLLYGGILPD